MIELSRVSKQYGNRCALDEITVQIDDSETVAILGPSGCGKSTLLRMIAGLESPDRGTINLDGLPANSLAPNERNCSVAFQNGLCYEHWSVQTNIQMSAQNQSPELVQWVIRALELNEQSNQFPAELSGGELQRVSLARALASNRKRLLLDEPLAQLHPLLRIKIRRALRDYHKKQKRTMLYVTHDVKEALYLADRIILMDKGKIRSDMTIRPETILSLRSDLRDYFTEMDLGPTISDILTVRVEPIMLGDWIAPANDAIVDEQSCYYQGHLVGVRWLGEGWEMEFEPTPGCQTPKELSIDCRLSDSEPEKWHLFYSQFQVHDRRLVTKLAECQSKSILKDPIRIKFCSLQ